MKHHCIVFGVIVGALVAAPRLSSADRTNAEWHMGFAVKACVEGQVVRHRKDKLLPYSDSHLPEVKKAFEEYQRYRDMALKDDAAIKSSKTIAKDKPHVLGNDEMKQQSFAAWMAECDGFFPKEVEDVTAADKPKELRRIAQLCARVMTSVAKGDHTYDIKNVYTEFKEQRDKALKADPALKDTQIRLQGDELGGVTDRKLVQATLYEWIEYCDAWYPKAVAGDVAAEKKEAAEDAKWVAKLKGDRKRLQHEEGWPANTSEGTDYPKMIHATWWSFSSIPTRNGGFACNEIFYFSGDKISRRKTEGLCR